MSLQSYPSAEGSALALIDAMIFSFEKTHNRIIESKAFQALKTNQLLDTSSNLKSPSTIPLTTATTQISADQNNSTDLQTLDEITTKTIQIVEELRSVQCQSWRLQIVPTDFYDRDLEYRATTILSAASPKSLFKSLLMRNTKCIRDDCNDPLNSKYYLVMVPYTEKMKQQKLNKFVKSLGKKSNKYYKFTFASLEETRLLTGFEYNTVSPIGIGNIPIISSHHIKGEEQIWIGSGSLRATLRIHAAEFIQKWTPFVADITA